MTLATVANDILKFTPGLNLDIIKSTIQSSYEELCSKDWSQLKLQRQTYTVVPYSTGTVSVATTGVVTGVGTAFTAAMVGRFMHVYYGDSFFEILSYSSGTSITLKDWTGAVIAAGTKFDIFKTIYPVDSTFGIVFDVIYQVSLLKKSQAYFNHIDPARISTASSPLYWAYAGKAATDEIQIEVYPVPSSAVPLRVYGKIKAATLGDTDITKLSEVLVRGHALIDCFELKDLQLPGQGWDKKKDKQLMRYAMLLQQYEDEDFQLDSHRDRVKDMSAEPVIPSDDNFALSHDVG